jgi:hypothetical protein
MARTEPGHRRTAKRCRTPRSARGSTASGITNLLRITAVTCALRSPLLSRSWGLHPPCRSGSEVVPQSLCPWLADMELSGSEAPREPGPPPAACEQLSRPLPQRVHVAPGLGRDVRLNLGTADDHQQQFIGPDQRHRRPRGHRRASKPVAQAVSDVGGERRRDGPARAANVPVREPASRGARSQASPSNSRRSGRPP